jgi:hypothetical protein
MSGIPFQKVFKPEKLEAAEDRRIVRALAEIEQRLKRQVDPTARVDDYTNDTLIDLLDAGYSIDECVQKLELK